MQGFEKEVEDTLNEIEMSGLVPPRSVTTEVAILRADEPPHKPLVVLL